MGHNPIPCARPPETPEARFRREITPRPPRGQWMLAEGMSALVAIMIVALTVWATRE